MVRYLLCSTALMLAGPALAQETAPAGQAAPQQETTATPEQSQQQASTVDVAAVVDTEFPSYDSDKNGELSKEEFSKWMTTLKKAEGAATGKTLGDQEITAWAGAAFTMADQDKSKAVSKTELVSYLGG